MFEVSVIIPTFNESQNILRVINEIENNLKNCDYEIIVVDDNSPDGTADTVKKYTTSNSRVSCIKRTWKKGLSSAVVEGYALSTKKHICVIDGDGQHDPKNLELFIEAFENNELDIVIGSRFLNKSKTHGLSTARNTLSNIGIKITDPYPPGLFRGYYQDQKKTSEVFKNGWYFTGDTATKDKDGYFWFVGRSDDIITSSGYRISPFEVESVLLEHPYIVEAAVVAKPDKVRGEIVAAFIVLGKNYNGNRKLKLEIQEFVKNNTAPYKYPREIVFTKNLPKTISGKIRRIDLRNKIIKI